MPPTANAGTNQTVYLPFGMATVNVSLDGTHSAALPNTSIATYAWIGQPKPDDVARPTVTLGEGQHTFGLIVTDNAGATSAPAQVVITVQKRQLLSSRTQEVIYLIGIYIAMIAGMGAKTLFDHWTRGTELKWENFLAPLVISPLIYGIIFGHARGSPNQIMMLIFGFQNGFFWQDIFSQIKTPTGGGTSTGRSGGG